MKENKIKSIFINLVKYILLFVILISSYILLMMLVGMIPSKLLTDNVKKSSEVLVEEGERKSIDLGYKREYLFTFTDALMINTAYSMTPTDLLGSAMLGRKNYIPGQTLKVHIDSQYNLGACDDYINKKNGDLYQTKELYALMHGKNITDSFEYARYWHGYLVLLRPLLAITTYSGIRIIILLATIILIVLLLYKLYHKTDVWTAVIFLIGLLSISIFVVAQSINEILVFLIAIIFSLILLNKKDLHKHITEIFFIAGSITNFIDLLTAPLVTLGLPLIVYIILLQKEKNRLKDILKKCVKVCLAWGFAYGFTWILKWILIQLIYGRPIVTQALEQARYRSGIGKNNVRFTDALKRNINYLSNNLIIIISGLMIVYSVVNIILNHKLKIDLKVKLKANLKEAIPYILTFFLPILWFIALKEHSYVHAFFTYRIFIITIISAFMILYKLFKAKDEKCQNW